MIGCLGIYSNMVPISLHTNHIFQPVRSHGWQGQILATCPLPFRWDAKSQQAKETHPQKSSNMHRHLQTSTPNPQNFHKDSCSFLLGVFFVFLNTLCAADMIGYTYILWQDRCLDFLLVVFGLISEAPRVTSGVVKCQHSWDGKISITRGFLSLCEEVIGPQKPTQKTFSWSGFG